MIEMEKWEEQPYREVIEKTWRSPVGELVLGACQDKLCMCDWAQSKRHQSNKKRIQKLLRCVFKSGESDAISKSIIELEDYFNGYHKISGTPLLMLGTDFQIKVWNELLNIKYGSTVSYCEIANRIGNVNAVRAVASAVASNPISIFIPCHRVIGSNQALTGYAGGLDAKLKLLQIEGAICANK